MRDKKQEKSGQSMLEYFVLVTSVIVAGLIFLKHNGVFQKAFNKTYDVNINFMVNMANSILK